jgi:hypothetical protein
VEWQHPDLCVTPEEKVLDAVMLWAANRDEIHGWDDANCHANNLEQDHLFGQREEDLESLLPLVHFPSISLPVLEMLQNSDLCTLSKLIPSLKKLVGLCILTHVHVLHCIEFNIMDTCL